MTTYDINSYEGPILKCPTCVEEDKESFIRVFPGSRTALFAQPFYDKEGRYHVHDPNVTTYNYKCSNGHEWSDRKIDGICWCGWPNKK